MKSLYVRFLAATLTFLIGVTATFIWVFYERRDVTPHPGGAAKPDIGGTAKSPVVTHDPCSAVQNTKKKLTPSEAVQRAECFIIQNGYTDLPPLEDKSRLTPESVWPGTDDFGMGKRRDSLERRAFGYWRGARERDDWVILFRMKFKQEAARLIHNYQEYIAKNGRAVTMDAYGNHVRVEHADFDLSSPKLEKAPLEK